MEKEEIDFKLKTLEWEGLVDISKVKKDIEEIEMQGATHIKIEHGVSYEVSYVEVDAICRRIETDVELKRKEEQERYKSKIIEHWEREQLEKLKAKYENK